MCDFLSCLILFLYFSFYIFFLYLNEICWCISIVLLEILHECCALSSCDGSPPSKVTRGPAALHAVVSRCCVQWDWASLCLAQCSWTPVAPIWLRIVLLETFCIAGSASSWWEMGSLASASQNHCWSWWNVWCQPESAGAAASPMKWPCQEWWEARNERERKSVWLKGTAIDMVSFTGKSLSHFERLMIRRLVAVYDLLLDSFH